MRTGDVRSPARVDRSALYLQPLGVCVLPDGQAGFDAGFCGGGGGGFDAAGAGPGWGGGGGGFAKAGAGPGCGGGGDGGGVGLTNAGTGSGCGGGACGFTKAGVDSRGCGGGCSGFTNAGAVPGGCGSGCSGFTNAGAAPMGAVAAAVSRTRSTGDSGWGGVGTVARRGRAKLAPRLPVLPGASAPRDHGIRQRHAEFRPAAGPAPGPGARPQRHRSRRPHEGGHGSRGGNWQKEALTRRWRWRQGGEFARPLRQEE